MKKVNLKYIVMCVGLILGANNIVFAAPQEAEGVSTSISKEDVNDILIWAKNSVTSLNKTIENYGFVELQKRKQFMRYKIEETLKDSGKAENELLMRITLNRTLALDALLDATPTSKNPELLLGMQMIEEGIEIAKELYQSDIDYLDKVKSGKQASLDFSKSSFALIKKFTKYSSFLSKDREVQFKKLLLVWYGNDLVKTPELRRENAALIKDLYNITQGKDNDFLSANNLNTILQNTILSITGNETKTFVKLEEINPVERSLLPESGVYFLSTDFGCGLEIKTINDTMFEASISKKKDPKYEKGWDCSAAAKKYGKGIYHISSKNIFYVEDKDSNWFINNIFKGEDNTLMAKTSDGDNYNLKK